MISSCAFSISAAQHTTFTSISAIGAAIRIGDTIFIDQTIFIGATANFFCANVVLAELEIGTTRVAVTRWLANALQTQLITDAVAIRCTNGATNASVANGSRWTLVVSAAVLNGYASEQRIASCARLTCTDADVIFDHAIRCNTTCICYRARVHTFRVQTGFRARTIVVLTTFDLFAFDRWIAASVRWAFAEGAMGVDGALSIYATSRRQITGIGAFRVDASGRIWAIGIGETFFGVSAAS